jgi:predicted nucleic acid-binding protein
MPIHCQEINQDYHFLFMLPAKVSPLCDKADSSVLEYTFEGKADYIVSGDRHLLELKKSQKPLLSSPIKIDNYIRKKHNILEGKRCMNVDSIPLLYQ